MKTFHVQADFSNGAPQKQPALLPSQKNRPCFHNKGAKGTQTTTKISYTTFRLQCETSCHAVGESYYTDIGKYCK